MDQTGLDLPPSVSIIVPARNEKPYIEKIVRELPKFPGEQEIIFVEGHSNDGTLEEIKRMADKFQVLVPIRYFQQDGVGKADAVWKGLANAQHEILMIYDADMTVPPKDLINFYQAAAADEQVFVNGSRLMLKMESGAMRPFNYLGNKFFARLLSFTSKRKLTDTLCGTKVIRRSHFENLRKIPWLWEIDDPFCDFTLIYGAAALDLKIIEVPVIYRRRLYDQTKIRRFRDGWKLLKIALKAYRSL